MGEVGRNRLPAGIVAVALLLGPLLAGCSIRPDDAGGIAAVGASRGSNLLLVTLDTTRADRLGCYGHTAARTPTLDALAREGLLFRQAATTAPITLPAHASLLTGLYPRRHGVRHNGEFRLGAEHGTLAEDLGAAGYETAAFVSAFVLDARYGLDQGFEHYDDRVTAEPTATFPVGTVERPAPVVTDAAIDWLQQRSPHRPFFAWVHYFDPHAPYQAPRPFAGGATAYDDEIAFVDHHLGRLLAGLAALGAQQRTLVVVVGDHGEGLGEHGEATHAFFVYDSVMRVPLIVSQPGVLDPAEIAAPVSIVDLVPTLLDLLGVAARERATDGVSLARSIPGLERAVELESLAPWLDYGWSPLFARRNAESKFIAAPRPERYDLLADPGERTNVAAEGGPLPPELRRRLSTWRSELDAAEGVTPSPEEADRLGALGYLGGAGPGGGALRDPKDGVTVVAALFAAQQLLETGRLQAALELVRRTDEDSPGDPSVLRLRGKLSLLAGLEGEAAAAYRAALSIRPTMEVLVPLAQILIRRGEPGEAGALLDAAEAIDPVHGGALIARGDWLLARGLRAEALAAYERAAEVDPYRAAEPARRRRDLVAAGGSPL